MKIGLSLALFMGIAILAIASNLSAGVPDSIAFQGQLTGSTGSVVPDGNYVLILSLWTDSLGGTMVWSEDRPVTTKSGLFATCLGCVNPISGVLGDQPLWLQTQIGGSAPLEPRIRLSSVPYAMVSGGIRGDVHTESGLLRVRENLGSSGQDGIEVLADPSSSSVRVACCLGSSGEDGVEVLANDTQNRVRVGNIGSSGEDGVSITDDEESSTVQLARKRPGKVKYTNITLRAFPDSVSDFRDCDDDDDGVPESEYSQRLTPITSSVAIKTKGTGADANRTVSVLSGTDVSSAVHRSEIDDDGDGVAESQLENRCTVDSVVQVAEISDGSSSSSIHTRTRLHELENILKNIGLLHTTSSSQACDDTAASVSCDIDDDGDGVPENEASLRVTPTTSHLAINSKGTSAKRLSAGTDCDDEASTNYLDCDDDGDGVAESSVSSSSSSDGSDMTLEARIDGTPARISTNFTVSKQSQGVDFGQRFDSDGDGLAETSMTSTVQRKSGSIVYLDREGSDVLRTMVGVDSTRSVISTDHDSDDDGIPEDEAVMRVIPGTSSMAIKTKGTGASNARTTSIASSTTIGDVATVSTIDDDGDGVPESEISQSLTPTTSAMAIKTKGTGAAHNRSISSTCDDASAVQLLDADDDGDGLADRQVTSSVDSDSAQMLAAGSDVQVLMKVKNKGVIKGSIIIVNANRSVVDFDSDGDGYLDNSLGVGVDATHRIDVAGGAYCDGSVWANASDARLKENFRPIDGEQLLNKLEALAITQWNYKNSGDKATHIGPTAQEFYSAFGVGNDSLSISTIDPSGIALAAIKELSRRSRELDQKVERIAELETQINELKAIVTKLAAQGEI